MILKRVSLDFPINRLFSVLIIFPLLLMFPRQTFSVPYALIIDQRGGGRVVVVNLDKKTVAETIDVGINPEGIEAYGTADGGYAYVTNSGSNNVSVIEINVPNSRVIETISGSFDAPRHLDTTSDNSHVLVTNTGMGNIYGITVIDTLYNSVVMTVPPISAGFEPGDIETWGDYTYVSYPDEFVARVLDIDFTNIEYNIVWETSTSPDRPTRIYAVPDYIYAITGSTVSKIGDNNYYYTLPVTFITPTNIDMQPNESYLYVTDKGDNTVKIIDKITDELSTTIGVGTSPNGIDFYGDFAYIVNSGSRTISVIDTSTSPDSLFETISDLSLITPIEIEIIEGPDNLPPYEPYLPYPMDGEMGIPVSTTLSWEGGDPDDDPVTYEVFMGTDTSMGLDQVCTGIVHPDTFCTPSISPLEYGTTYYWMVVATDSGGLTSEVPSPYWSFTTEESPAPCEVTITPESPTVGLGEILQFIASTTCNGAEVSGDYFWDLSSAIGSAIDVNGLYTAGNAEGTDIVTVIDIANGEVTATTQVTVIAGPLCVVTISTQSETVSSGETIAFSATTSPPSPGIECEVPSYQWEVDSPIGSSITQDGLYTAGFNDTGEDRLDVITVTDTANGNITDVAEIMVLAEPPKEYIVLITPEEITLPSLKPFRFTAQTLEVETNTPVPVEECRYKWEISPPSTIKSTIFPDGKDGGWYIPGLNNTRDLLTETVRVYDTAHNDASATATVTVFLRYTSFYLPPGPLVTSYRMISVPLVPIEGDALHIITGGMIKYNPFLIRLFRWDGQAGEDGQGGYREYPDLPDLEPGVGIWVITLPGGIIKVAGTPIDTSQDFTITLPPGWSQIGHPFPFPVDWNQVDASPEVEKPWTFVGLYLLASFLRPWHGYFIFNNSSSSITISIPPLESEGRISKTYTPLSEKEEGWQLQMGANDIPFFWLQDTYNFIGVSEGSSAERDPKDLHKPPPVSPNQLSLYFSHEWEGKPERYATDFRSLHSQKEIFECTVNPGSGIISLIRLFWSGMAKVPEEYQMEFTDPETGITLNMREVSEYWFISYLGIDKHFKISMTKTSH